MSNLGMRILYGLMNNMDGVWCERVFAPWGDMEEEMRRDGMPLYGLESGDPIRDFDIIGFSVGYEMAFPEHAEYAGSGGRAAPRERAHGADPARRRGRHVRVQLVSRSRILLTLSELGEGEEVNVELIELLPQGAARGLDEAGVSPCRRADRRRLCSRSLRGGLQR